MTTVSLLPLTRWRGADPDQIIDHALAQGMELDQAFAFIDQIAKRLDRQMRRMDIPLAQRRAALDGWHHDVYGGLIWIIVGDPRGRATR